MEASDSRFLLNLRDDLLPDFRDDLFSSFEDVS